MKNFWVIGIAILLPTFGHCTAADKLPSLISCSSTEYFAGDFSNGAAKIGYTQTLRFKRKSDAKYILAPDGADFSFRLLLNGAVLELFTRETSYAFDLGAGKYFGIQAAMAGTESQFPPVGFLSSGVCTFGW
ncbi:hypothetical protein [Rheinheimera fenheensis]|uniref:hypothetical protein n=1 Tax=Rheinheimera fenheensis TaxID=3152295 RepID=UPI00325CBBA1